MENSDASTDSSRQTSMPELCVSHQECSDGLFCNGVEHCNPGAKDADEYGCVRATRGPCDENEYCDERERKCVKDVVTSDAHVTESDITDTGTVITDASGSDSSAGTVDASVKNSSVAVTYTCGGDNATCDLLDANSCGQGQGCQFLVPASGVGEPYAQCVTAGSRQVGDACDDDNPCVAGLDCSAGFCYKYCCDVGSTSQCPNDQACIIDVLNFNDKSTGVFLCDECDDCNPLTAQGCDSGLGCYPIPASDTDIGCRLCLPSLDNKDVGERCDSVNDCKPGVGCYSINDSDPVCTSFCDLTAGEDPCEPDSTCRGNLLGEASVDNTVGLCLPNY